MRRRAPWTTLGLILLGVVSSWLVACKQSDDVSTDPATDTEEEQPLPLSEDRETEQISLLFPGEGDRLYPETREIPAEGAVEGRIQAVVEALLAGPTTDGLRPPLPDGVRVQAVHLLEEQGTLVLDLGPPEGESPMVTGSMREMLAVYSLVNTVTSTFPEVERLQILWNGRQPTTFAGHIDTSRPLVPNPGLLAVSAQ